jgi:hypothetical protein
MLWLDSIPRSKSTLENFGSNLQTIHDAHVCAHDLQYVRAPSLGRLCLYKEQQTREAKRITIR